MVKAQITKKQKEVCERTTAVEIDACEPIENRNENLYLNKTEKKKIVIVMR